MKTPGKWCREWHEIAGLPVRLRAQWISRVERELRDTLIDEERVELRGAMHDPQTDIEEEALAAVAGELADLVIVLYSTADYYGIELDEAVRLKIEANFRKVPECPDCGGSGIDGFVPCDTCGGSGRGEPTVRSDGKILKPEDWQPPNMMEALRG